MKEVRGQRVQFAWQPRLRFGYKFINCELHCTPDDEGMDDCSFVDCRFVGTISGGMLGMSPSVRAAKHQDGRLLSWGTEVVRCDFSQCELLNVWVFGENTHIFPAEATVEKVFEYGEICVSVDTRPLSERDDLRNWLAAVAEYDSLVGPPDPEAMQQPEPRTLPKIKPGKGTRTN